MTTSIQNKLKSVRFLISLQWPLCYHDRTNWRKNFVLCKIMMKLSMKNWGCCEFKRHFLCLNFFGLIYVYLERLWERMREPSSVRPSKGLTPSTNSFSILIFSSWLPGHMSTETKLVFPKIWRQVESQWAWDDVSCRLQKLCSLTGIFQCHEEVICSNGPCDQRIYILDPRSKHALSLIWSTGFINNETPFYNVVNNVNI